MGQAPLTSVDRVTFSIDQILEGGTCTRLWKISALGHAGYTCWLKWAGAWLQQNQIWVESQPLAKDMLGQACVFLAIPWNDLQKGAGQVQSQFSSHFYYMLCQWGSPLSSAAALVSRAHVQFTNLWALVHFPPQWIVPETQRKQKFWGLELFFILYFHSIINFKLCFQLGTCIHGWKRWLWNTSVLARKVWSLEANSAKPWDTVVAVDMLLVLRLPTRPQVL